MEVRSLLKLCSVTLNELLPKLGTLFFPESKNASIWIPARFDIWGIAVLKETWVIQQTWAAHSLGARHQARCLDPEYQNLLSILGQGWGL